jgi:hypothetical protein
LEIKRYVLLMLHAPGRVAQAVDLLSRSGAGRIQVVHRAGAETPVAVHSAPIVRRGRRSTHVDVAAD